MRDELVVDYPFRELVPFLQVTEHVPSARLHHTRQVQIGTMTTDRP